VIVAILVAENGRVEDSELKRALALTESLRNRLKESKRGRRGLVANGYEISFLGDGDVLELGCGDVCTTIVNILKTLNCML